MTTLTDGFMRSDEVGSAAQAMSVLSTELATEGLGGFVIGGSWNQLSLETESFGDIGVANLGRTTLFVEDNIRKEALQVWFAGEFYQHLKLWGSPARDTLTERRYRTSNTTSQLIAEGEQILRDTRNRSRYQARIDELIGFGLQEGIKLNSASELDFWSYMTTMPHTRTAGLVLTDDGNLRAVWKDGAESRLAIEFLGEGQAEYVIFRRRRESATISRVAGTDTFEGIRAQIRAFDLGFLVNE